MEERPHASSPLWIRPIPNVLSGLRLVIAVGFPAAPIAWRLPLVIMGGASDLVDGFIARRFHATTWFGGILDAIADKFFTLSVLIVLTLDGDLAWWQAGLLMARDFSVAAACIVLVSRRRWSEFKRMKSRSFGRVTTVSLFSMFVVILAWPEAVAIIWILFMITAVINVIAAIDYFRQFQRVLFTHSPEMKPEAGSE